MTSPSTYTGPTDHIGLTETPDIDTLPRQIETDNLHIEPHVCGSREYLKVSYALKTGCFSRIETPDTIFEFNLNREIRHVRSKKNWHHASEWLKRTLGNDWVYYSTGGYAGVVESIGEFYLPNLNYSSNSILGGRPFREAEVADLSENWYQRLTDIDLSGLPSNAVAFIESVQAVTPEMLAQKAQDLFDIIGRRVSVLPPDARHVDYNVIPLTISDGCLYKCRFCQVKNPVPFAPRPMMEIREQADALRALYGEDIINTNAVFLGEHDAFAAPGRLILESARLAYDVFEFENSYMKDAYLFTFASVNSLMGKDMAFFEELNALPYFTYINVGLESYDEETLEKLGKPVSKKNIGRAFELIRHLNQAFPKIEVSCNFVTDDALPQGHIPSLMDLLGRRKGKPVPKGCIYLSPLQFDTQSRPALYEFYNLKSLSRFPTFLYLIQRL